MRKRLIVGMVAVLCAAAILAAVLKVDLHAEPPEGVIVMEVENVAGGVRVKGMLASSARTVSSARAWREGDAMVFAVDAGLAGFAPSQGGATGDFEVVLNVDGPDQIKRIVCQGWSRLNRSTVWEASARGQGIE